MSADIGYSLFYNERLNLVLDILRNDPFIQDCIKREWENMPEQKKTDWRDRSVAPYSIPFEIIDKDLCFYDSVSLNDVTEWDRLTNSTDLVIHCTKISIDYSPIFKTTFEEITQNSAGFTRADLVSTISKRLRECKAIDGSVLTTDENRLHTVIRNHVTGVFKIDIV